MFRSHWQIEDESIRANLSLTSHIAFLHTTMEFVEKYAKEHRVQKADVYHEITDEVLDARPSQSM